MDELILSQDGSHTIMSDKFGVSYHSKYGALQETRTVFLEAGLSHALLQEKENINILEMGFGTGLNAIMTLLEAPQSQHITYHTIEAYPISLAQAQELNYPDVLNMDVQQFDAFMAMHKSESGESIELNSHFNFQKNIMKLEDFSSDLLYDVIYYDAFAPTSQEELWTEEMMQKMYDFCAQNGVLVTYCAKGSFKRALKAAGFTVEGLPGPIGKREMTRALKL